MSSSSAGGPVHGASQRIRPYLAPTPLVEARGLATDGDLVLKLENRQPTGSFKVRGAFSKLLGLDDDARGRGVVAASTGNHGAAVAYAARELDIEALVVVPVTTPAARIEAIERLGARTRRIGAECGAAEAAARELAGAGGQTFVSPYNDGDVMAGQGTLALELGAEATRPARIYVAVGGGGLVGGIALGLREIGLEVDRNGGAGRIEVVGCSPEASYAMEAAVRAGRIVDVPHLETLSLATAGALEEDTVTFAPCASGVDRWLRVDEAEIAESLRALYRAEGIVAEGAAGVALACWAKDAARRAPGERSCVVVCGGNLDPEHRRDVLGLV